MFQGVHPGQKPLGAELRGPENRGGILVAGDGSPALLEHQGVPQQKDPPLKKPGQLGALPLFQADAPLGQGELIVPGHKAQQGTGPGLDGVVALSLQLRNGPPQNAAAALAIRRTICSAAM